MKCCSFTPDTWVPEAEAQAGLGSCHLQNAPCAACKYLDPRSEAVHHTLRKVRDLHTATRFADAATADVLGAAQRS